jgi:hypothetical protein
MWGRLALVAVAVSKCAIHRWGRLALMVAASGTTAQPVAAEAPE